MSQVELKRPTAILMKVLDVITSKEFLGQTVLPFIKKHIDKYVKEYWGEPDCWDVIVLCKKESDNERMAKGNYQAPRVADPMETDTSIQDTFVEYVIWLCSSNKTAENSIGFKKLQSEFLAYGCLKNLFQLQYVN